MGDVILPLSLWHYPGAIAMGWGPSPMAPHRGDAPTLLCGWVAGGGVARGSLAHRVPLAEAGAEQALRTNILGPTSIQVLWTGAREARGYRLEWKRATGGLGAPGLPHRLPVLAASSDPPFLTGPEPPRTVSLPSSTNTYQLTGLQPGTVYRITLYMLYDGGEVATPVTTFQTGEQSPLVPWVVPHLTSHWDGGMSHMALLKPGDPFGHETPSSPIVAQGEDGRHAVRAAWLRPCLTHPFAGVEVPVGAVLDLRLVEEAGRRVRLGWTSVPGATEYKVVVRNNQGESAGRSAGGTWGTPAGQR